MDIALAIVLDRTHSHTLISQRPTGVHLEGYWEFPGGKMELGESAMDCAVREAFEETGLDVAVLEEWPPVTFVYPDRNVTLSPVLCLSMSETIALGPWIWVGIDDLESYRFPDANVSIIQQLFEWRSANRAIAAPD